MSSLSLNPEQWYADYEVASPLKRYSMIQSVLELPLSEEFIIETDLAGIIIDIQYELFKANQLTEIIALIDKIQQNQPDLYAQEYFYFDKFLIKYYLYTSDFDKVKASLVRFQEYPDKDIDQMLRVVDFLTFYNATEIVTNLCQATYNQVENSSKVVSGTGVELAGVILFNLMDSTYEAIKQGETVNWDDFLTQVEEYGYQLNEDWINNFQEDLKENIEVNEQFFQQFKHQQYKDKILRRLSLQFFQYMRDKKQVSFICSQAIFQNIMHFLVEYRELKNKELNHPHSLFQFSENELDRFLAGQMGGFFSFRQALGFATLWGVQYFYDFLLAKQVITVEIHQKAIKSVSSLKKQLIIGFPNLWEFDFVHRWLPPDSISETEWNAEIALFAVNEDMIKPLSDEPPSNNKGRFDSNLFDLLGNNDLFKESELATPSSSGKTKPPKKKKTPLQEVAQLFPKKPKKSPKKQKKGF